LVNNVAFTLIARAVTSIGLFMLQRGVATIDKISDMLDTMRDQQFETAGEIRALKATSSTQRQIIADHEARVRILERTAPPIGRN
jgi:hypothetical protein